MRKGNTGRNLKIQDARVFGRGLLTTDVVKTAEIMLGHKISQAELRLIPYIQYVMVNDRKLDPNKINSEERTILADWKKRGYIEGGACGLAVTKQFWDFMCEVLFLSYVGFDNPDISADTRG